MALKDYTNTELAPRKLEKEEIKDPMLVLDAFFDYAHLPQVREMLWTLLKTTVTSSYHKQTVVERCDQVYFFERIEQLIEAAYIIHARNTSKK